MEVIPRGSYNNGWEMYGDNSGFSGLFVIGDYNSDGKNRQKTRWSSVNAGSANATWEVQSSDGFYSSALCLSYPTEDGNVKFGELVGNGKITGDRLLQWRSAVRIQILNAG